MNRSIRSTVGRSLLLALGIVGCNTILDNKPGRPDDSATRTDTNATEPTTDSGSPGVPHDGRSDGGNQSPECAPGQHRCHGFCVGLTDPSYGCGNPSCEACNSPHGTPTCQGNGCVIQACDKGYADCNQKPDDGCEVDLSKATTCGSCNAVCPAANPVCAPSGESFQCTTGCAPAAPLLCGAECVSPLTSVNHCGGCNARCADVAHGTAACEAGQCTFTCKPSYHACAGKCVLVTDPTACGPQCTVCPVPANAAATCQADACGFQCNAGFGNCNQNAADGCESNFATDRLNCGGCGKSCDGGTCNNGVCAPPAPDAGR